MTEHSQSTRTYPDEPTGPFPTPPAQIIDREGRSITIRAADTVDDSLVEILTAMYVQFDSADRAQGIPPIGEQAIKSWLESIVETGINVLAREGSSVIGHALLAPETDLREPNSESRAETEWELAIFILQSHQRAGIGTHLLEHLLGHARELGVERVWLTVERWNTAAISVYETVGFEQTGSATFEKEMTIRLDD